MDTSAIRIALWCEEDDYARFRFMNGGDALPSRYEQWAELAQRELNDLLGHGCAAQIVRVRPEEYFAWLQQHSAADTPLSRKRYMEELAAKAGGVLPMKPTGVAAIPTHR